MGNSIWKGGSRLKGKWIPSRLDLVSEDQRLPVGTHSQQVVVHSVFSPTRFVERPLSAEEYFDAYDLDLASQKAILALYQDSTGLPELRLVHHPPGKILYRLAETVLAQTPELKSVETQTWNLEAKGTITSEETCLDLKEACERENPDIKATKADDAKADIVIWNLRCLGSYRPDINRPVDQPKICKGGYLESTHGRIFDAIRMLLMRRFRRTLFQGFVASMKARHGPRVIQEGQEHCRDARKRKRHSGKQKRRSKVETERETHRIIEIKADLAVGRDALHRGLGSTWWDWCLGSTLFFWRWPEEYRLSARDGAAVYVNGTLPVYWKEPRWPTDPGQVDKLRGKLKKVCTREYIADGFVQSLTGYFSVPKGEDDIRVVYDATQSGLNDALWAPNFFLPTVDSVLRKSGPKSWFGDIDLGEMFLNYPLDVRIQPYAGVDVTRLELKEPIRGKRQFRRWTRNLMGCKTSPYLSTQGFAWSEEIIRGNRLAPSNPLGWDKVVLNLPGSRAYDPGMPWVYRIKSETGEMAGFFETYVDDIRTGGNSEDHCFQVARQVAARTNYLGQQDAPRKRRRPSQTPGAWAGAMVVHRKEEGLFVTCSQDKWSKGRGYVEELYETVVTGNTSFLNRKALESMRGFLVHLSRTFTSITPYLKGIHNTLESWRSGRDEDGWKLTDTEWLAYLAGQEGMEDVTKYNLKQKRKQFRDEHEGTAPSEVAVVARLSNDLTALWRLFKPEQPPLRLIRGRAIAKAIYGFGDASGSGFGSVWQSDSGLHYRLGTWGRDKDSESSNFRELKNLVDTLLLMDKRQDLDGKEVFIFTDNSTAERAFRKGSSSSIKLFNLVLQLREMEMSGKCKIHFFHVSGRRMIQQGADGLSRGNLNEGVMQGNDMLDFVPTHLSALERSSGLVDWLQEQIGEDLEVLTPEGWFDRGHDIDGGYEDESGIWIPKYRSSTFVWFPPPAAAEVAVEELRKARHKRQNSSHIFVVPRLMSTLWEKQLHKAADVVFELKPTTAPWNEEMCEPLTIAIVFPFLKYRPWQLRRAPALLEMEKSMRGMRSTNLRPEGPFLRKLWKFARELDSMPKDMVWNVLQGEHTGPVSNRKTRKRRGPGLEKNAQRRPFSERKDR